MKKLKLTRPTCNTDGCNLPCKYQSKIRKDGTRGYCKYCSMCMNRRVAENKGMTLTEYQNSIHPYRHARLTYCENVDGRLGFRCTTTIKLAAQLEVDHIDGNPSNNNLSNLQTLCGCCHKYKTIMNGDHKTPGRKELGITY